MQYYTYILLCADGTYYTGSTNNLEKRIAHHNFHKAGAQYTKSRRPVKLAYYETYESLHDARVRENVIKRLKRGEKERLVVEFKI